jgi:hypothetical protein
MKSPHIAHRVTDYSRRRSVGTSSFMKCEHVKDINGEQLRRQSSSRFYCTEKVTFYPSLPAFNGTHSVMMITDLLHQGSQSIPNRAMPDKYVTQNGQRITNPKRAGGNARRQQDQQSAQAAKAASDPPPEDKKPATLSGSKATKPLFRNKNNKKRGSGDDKGNAGTSAAGTSTKK